MAQDTSRLTLSAADLASGRMPDVCALTGRPTDLRERVRYGWPNPSPWRFLWALAGLVPLLLAIYWAPRRVEGRLPLSRAAQRRRTALLTLGVFLAFAGVFLVCGFAAPAPYGTAIGTAGVVTLAAGAVVFQTRWAHGPVGRVFRMPNGEDWVVIANLHPDFVAAYQAQFTGSGAPAAPAAAESGSTLVPATGV